MEAPSPLAACQEAGTHNDSSEIIFDELITPLSSPPKNSQVNGKKVLKCLYPG